jgi:hypothetical protein
MGQHRKCVYCDKPAMAYRLGEDGSRTYLCEDHVPCGENETQNRSPPELRMMQPPTIKDDRN